MRHTVDAPTAPEALPARYNGRAAAKCRAWLGNMKARGARGRRKMTQEVQGLGVCGVVVRRGACLE
jgi:hypothetical protein